MNAYYHSFEIGFNFWMVFVFVALLVMGALGAFTYKWAKPEPVRVVSDRVVKRLVAVLSVIFCILLFVESMDGIIQALDNHLDAHISAAWSIIVFPFAMIFIIVVFAALLYVVYYAASLIKLGRLYEQMRVQRERREYREAKRLAARQASRQYKIDSSDLVFTELMTIKTNRKKHRRLR